MYFPLGRCQVSELHGVFGSGAPVRHIPLQNHFIWEFQDEYEFQST